MSFFSFKLNFLAAIIPAIWAAGLDLRLLGELI